MLKLFQHLLSVPLPVIGEAKENNNLAEGHAYLRDASA